MPNSCTKCNGSVKGHEGPCGANCTLAPLPPEEQQDGSSEDVSEVEYLCRRAENFVGSRRAKSAASKRTS